MLIGSARLGLPAVLFLSSTKGSVYLGPEDGAHGVQFPEKFPPPDWLGGTGRKTS
jgi:hypothetical protein